MMRFSFTSYTRTGSPDPTPETTNPVWSSPGALSDLHDALGAIADLETQYEIERDKIEQSSGAEDMKKRDMAALEDAHQHRREPHVQQWAKLQGHTE